MRFKFLNIGGVALAVIGFLIFMLLGQGTMPKQESNNQEGKESWDTVIPEPIDKRASFAIFTNGTFRIFIDPRYHNQSSDVYIEGPEHSNVVIVKKDGITWGDFFKTLPMSLTKDCLTTGTGQSFCTGEAGILGFYINGERVNNALGMEISGGDRLLVSFGNQNEEEIKSQLSQIPALPAGGPN